MIARRLPGIYSVRFGRPGGLPLRNDENFCVSPRIGGVKNVADLIHHIASITLCHKRSRVALHIGMDFIRDVARFLDARFLWVELDACPALEVLDFFALSGEVSKHMVGRTICLGWLMIARTSKIVAHIQSDKLQCFLKWLS